MRALTGAAIGAGLVVVSAVSGWWAAEMKRPRHAIVLTYNKGGGTMMTGARGIIDDPTSIEMPATHYPAWIASRCGLKRWTMTNNEGSTDVPDEAVLSIPEDELDDRQFSCLSSFIKPGYVTLTRITN